METSVEIEKVYSDELLKLELELKRIQIQELIDDISERRKYRRWSFFFILIWLSAISLIMIFDPSAGSAGFPLAAITLLVGQMVLLTTKSLYNQNPKPNIFQALKEKFINSNS